MLRQEGDAVKESCLPIAYLLLGRILPSRGWNPFGKSTERIVPPSGVPDSPVDMLDKRLPVGIFQRGGWPPRLRTLGHDFTCHLVGKPSVLYQRASELLHGAPAGRNNADRGLDVELHAPLGVSRLAEEIGDDTKVTVGTCEELPVPTRATEPNSDNPAECNSNGFIVAVATANAAQRSVGVGGLGECNIAERTTLLDRHQNVAGLVDGGAPSWREMVVQGRG